MSFSVSDKGGEFVILPIQSQKDLTNHHLSNTGGVYKFEGPTRKYQGCYRSITNPTDVTYKRQISALTDRLEFKCNNLWQQIFSRRSLNSKMNRAFKVSNTQLPAMYVLVKTHKFDVNVICSLSDIVDKCKVRPIVSCCSSPTEKLAWLCTYILTPLLDVIPCHLKSIYDHLERLSHLNR